MANLLRCILSIIFQELKDSVQKEVNAVLDEKFEQWKSSLFIVNNTTHSKGASKESSECQKYKQGIPTDASDAWSPEYCRTQTLTRALTRSHSKRLDISEVI